MSNVTREEANEWWDDDIGGVTEAAPDEWWDDDIGGVTAPHATNGGTTTSATLASWRWAIPSATTTCGDSTLPGDDSSGAGR